MIYTFNNLQDVTLYRRGVMFKGEGEGGRVGRLWRLVWLSSGSLISARSVQLKFSKFHGLFISPRFVTAPDILLSVSPCIWPYLTQTGGFPRPVSAGWSQFVLETRLGRPQPWAGSGICVLMADRVTGLSLSRRQTVAENILQTPSTYF